MNANLLRLKNSIPFSISLNQFILNRFNDLAKVVNFEFTSFDDFDETDIKGTFERHKKRFEETNTIKIWSGCSENTVFGDSQINQYFRAWHDYIHITENLGYDFESESIVCMMQVSELPQINTFDRNLLIADVIGQNQYFLKYKKFPINQRLFAYFYLNNVKDALNNPTI